LGLARSTVESRLSGTTDKDGVTVSQTYGDGQSRSSGKQLIINTPGDAELKDGQAANSGMQAFDRVTSDPSCPSSLVCIDRLTFEPTTGDPMTFCFYDGTGKRVAVPYAIPPNIKYQELAPLAKVYGPYVAKRYRMPDMSCDNPIGEPDVVETYSTEIRQGPQPSPATQNFFIRAASFNFDYEAEMIHQRVANDNRAPYIDETIKMQAKTRYVFDAGKSTLVKMIKTVRSTVELPFPINLVMSMDGLQVDLHFELCENLMTGFEASYCD
jgi:hypothetical protein